MFGFLRIARRRLDDGDRAAYRAHFCATCHALRDFGGRPASLLTNYDATVFALVVGAFDRGGPATAAPCTALPLRRVGVQPLSAPVARFTAAFTIALADAKLEDDVADDGRWWSRMARRALGGRTTRARAALGDAGYDVARLDRLGAAQRSLEQSGSGDLLALSAATADALAAGFAVGVRLAGAPDAEPVAARIGAALARFVYVVDALEDRATDRRRGRFNAIDASIAAGGDEADAFALVRAELAAFRGGVDALPPGASRRVLGALHDTLIARVDRREAHGAPSSARFATQRGDCDCACPCDSPDCCSGGDGDAACGCCGDGCCDCCLWTRERKKRANG